MQQQFNGANSNSGTIVQALIGESLKYPLLTAEQEYELAVKYRDHRDENAKRLLVGSHLRLVIKIARSHAGYKVQMADLISEGNIGLMKALDKFDPEKGNRFSTYAVWWIRAQIREYSMHSFSQVKMGTTAAQKKLFFNLSRLLQNLESNRGGGISDEHVGMIAETLGVPRHEVISMAQRLANRDASLQVRGIDDEGADYQDKLIDGNKNPEEAFSEREELVFRRELMIRSLEVLSERERKIFETRYVCEDRHTLEELSRMFGVSRERIRQIETEAFVKIRKSVRNLAILSNLTVQTMQARPS